MHFEEDEEQSFDKEDLDARSPLKRTADGSKLRVPESKSNLSSSSKQSYSYLSEDSPSSEPTSNNTNKAETKIVNPMADKPAEKNPSKFLKSFAKNYESFKSFKE